MTTTDSVNDDNGAAPTKTKQERIDAALDLIINYGGIDGAHHKQWVLDQVVRALHEDNDGYLAWVHAYADGSDGPATYTWSKGIAP